MAWECYRLAALHGSIEAEKNLRAVEEVLESEEVKHALEREGFRLGVTGSSDLALQDISPDNMQVQQTM